MSDAEPVVLVVDDNADFLHVARALLGDAFPTSSVHTVSSGLEALAFLEHATGVAESPRPDFVLLDYHLPDFNAPEVLRRLRADPQLQSLPVLVLSQAAWEQDEAAARAAGAQQFSLKPSRVAELRRVIGNFYKEYVHGALRSAH